MPQIERRYKFFTVQRLPSETGRKTRRYEVRKTRSTGLLGIIAWYAAWRQFSFFPEDYTVWSAGCLADIQEAINWAESDRKGAADGNASNEE